MFQVVVLDIGVSRVNKKDIFPSFREWGNVLKEKSRVLGDLPDQRKQRSPPGKDCILTKTGKMNNQELARDGTRQYNLDRMEYSRNRVFRFI